MFISFEGGEGSGKSTQSRMLYDYFCKKYGKNHVILTREPGGTNLGEKIREVFLGNEMCHEAALMLNMAARAHHIKTIIKPALKAQKIVISDRYVDSSACYQGFLNKEIGVDKVYKLHEILLNNFMPDCTFVLNIQAIKAINRIKNRADNNRFDKKSIDFHEQISNGYLEIANRFPNRIKLLSADKEPEELFIDLLSKLP